MGTEVINNITHSYRGQAHIPARKPLKYVKSLCTKENTVCSNLHQEHESGIFRVSQPGTTSLSTILSTACVENFIFISWHTACLGQ
jgi:hypothetical protein